jgi:hypothetical protein
MMKGLIKKTALSLFILWVVLVLWGLLFAWRKVPEYIPEGSVLLPQPIMSSEEYGRFINTHPRPYIFRIETDNGGGVLIFGAEHTKNPNDPQINQIENEWVSFAPTVTLVESRLGILFPGLMDPVETFSEPGKVHALAREDGIQTYTWEPPTDIMMERLLSQSFTQEQIALRVVLGPAFSARRFGTAEDSETIVKESIQDKKDWPGIGGVFSSIEDVDAAWANYFPEGPDWRDVSDEYGLPGFLGEIETNLPRDEHFIQVIVDLVEQGERVFAIAGVSHAVKIEPALRGYFADHP